LIPKGSVEELGRVVVFIVVDVTVVIKVVVLSVEVAVIVRVVVEVVDVVEVVVVDVVDVVVESLVPNGRLHTNGRLTLLQETLLHSATPLSFSCPIATQFCPIEMFTTG
jgi:hypothetical protein